MRRWKSYSPPSLELGSVAERYTQDTRNVPLDCVISWVVGSNPTRPTKSTTSTSSRQLVTQLVIPSQGKGRKPVQRF